MKQTENNEIDLLLRSLARRDGAGAVAAEDLSSRHLDADELNSYAEQSLPAAARARYTSHLADCATCRRIVSELRSASGANVSDPPVPQKASAGFRQKVGALFSPGFLRYAAPVLALFVFIAVGLVALRQQPYPDFVAQNQPAATPGDVAIETAQTRSQADPANSSEFIEEPRSAESKAVAGKGKDRQAKAVETEETSNLARATDSVTVTSDREAATGKAVGVVASPSYAPEPNAPPTAKSQITHAEERNEVAGRKKEEADKKDEPAREQEGTRARTDANQNEVARPASGTGSLAVQSRDRLQKLESRSAKRAQPKTDENEADTRTVSGRRFRRQGDVWIDVAYQSSTATTVVSRGSEQFRALVADEPGIRAIAAQLSGEVVVVWKGRAYRIR